MAVNELFHKILCPVDLNHSLKALEFAISLAQQNDARLCVLYVAPIPIGATEVGMPSGEKYPWWEVGTRERLTKLANLKTTRRRELNSQAARLTAELIVVLLFIAGGTRTWRKP